MADTKSKKTITENTDHNEIELKAIIKRMFNDPNQGLKAFASVNIGDAFVVNGIMIRESENGIYVRMPFNKVNDDYRDVFHPITKEARQMLIDCVLHAYEQRLSGIQEKEMPDVTQEEVSLKM